MLLFFRFYALILFLSICIALCGCEESPSNLLPELPSQCSDASPAIRLTTPKRVFLFANVPHANKVPKSYVYAVSLFADQSTAKIDLWEDAFGIPPTVTILMDFAFADAIEMCNYFRDKNVQRGLEKLPRIAYGTPISKHVNTLTEKSVIDKDPAAKAFALRVYNINYLRDQRAEYLRTTIAVENALASQPEVLRMEVYENFYADRWPNRVLVISFRNIADLKTFINVSSTAAELEAQLQERAAKVSARDYVWRDRLRLDEGLVD